MPGRVRSTKCAGSSSGQSSAGCPAIAMRHSTTLSKNQLYASRYAPVSAPRCSTTQLAGGVAPSGAGSSFGTYAYAASTTRGSRRRSGWSMW
ncbi:hypothetical protein ACQP26_16115 [Micromonospora sp. CA-248089]|uniref:hypothetical protein n=1 Tax=Micromonospora sp. CA-248089 TaxID=3239960 RepID=UPI003D8F63E0